MATEEEHFQLQELNGEPRHVFEQEQADKKKSTRVRYVLICTVVLSLISVVGLSLGILIAHMTETTNDCNPNKISHKPNYSAQQRMINSPPNCIPITHNSGQTRTTESTKRHTFYGAHLFLEKTDGSGDLKWKLPQDSDKYSFITDGLELVNNSLIQIPQTGIYRTYCQLSFEIQNAQLSVTHYIKSTTSSTSTHDVLVRTKLTIGDTNRDLKQKRYQSSNVDGSVLLRKGAFVGVYVTQAAIKWISPVRKSNYFGLQLIEGLDMDYT